MRRQFCLLFALNTTKRLNSRLQSFSFHTKFVLARFRELTGRTHVQAKNTTKQGFTREKASVPVKNGICCEVHRRVSFR